MTQVHFIGIGGSGLSAIARLHLERGYTVTGSDRSLSPLALDLQKLGATIYPEHAADNVRGADWVVRSSAIPDDNVEVQAALTYGIPVYKRADYLGRLMEAKVGIGVAGTHGKTTTSAMLAWVLTQLGQDPTFIIGGVLTNLGVNAHDGRGAAFVIEADEYDRMFLGLKPRFEIVTNVEHDHPDCYPTPADFQAAFTEYISLVPEDGALVISGEDKGAIELTTAAKAMGKRVIAYRIAENSLTQAGEWALAQNLMINQRGGFTFNMIMRLQSGPQYISGVQLQVPGLHNVRNALAVLAVIALMGLSLRDAVLALRDFMGTNRRFEIKGVVNGITVVDDYAHHPTEIRATLDAARARYAASRIWAVWQPHTYSRTRALFAEFLVAFAEADQVIVSEIYASREPKEDFSAEKIVKSLNRNTAHFIPTLGAISDYLVDHLKPGDVVLVLSAGDADQVSVDVLARLNKGEKP